MTKPKNRVKIRASNERVISQRSWARQFAYAIRRNCGSQACRDQAIKAFLEVYLFANPQFNDKEFRAVANGTTDSNYIDEYFEKLKEKYAITEMGCTD